MIPRIYAPTALDGAISLLDSYFKESISGGTSFKSNQIIQMGWMIFMIAEKDGILEVQAPNFIDHPIIWGNDCSKALSMILMQKYTVESFFDNYGWCNLRQSALCSKEIDVRDDLFMNRVDDEKGNDSGWYIGTVDCETDVNDPANLEYRNLYQISLAKPQCNEFMLMPIDTQVVPGNPPVIMHNSEIIKPKKNSYWEKIIT